jgi:hypothetical protein
VVGGALLPQVLRFPRDLFTFLPNLPQCAFPVPDGLCRTGIVFDRARQ